MDIDLFTNALSKPAGPKSDGHVPYSPKCLVPDVASSHQCPSTRATSLTAHWRKRPFRSPARQHQKCRTPEQDQYRTHDNTFPSYPNPSSTIFLALGSRLKKRDSIWDSHVFSPHQHACTSPHLPDLSFVPTHTPALTHAQCKRGSSRYIVYTPLVRSALSNRQYSIFS
jgi:hypothetical protein